MKKISKLSLSALLFISMSLCAYSQDLGAANDETYVKNNIALTKFTILGVTAKHYAKCTESVNFLDEGKKLRFITIDKTEFADDGKDNDLVAGDGIMTSRVLFAYAQGQSVGQAGQYSMPNGSLVYDQNFKHADKIGSGRMSERIGITCDYRWQSCNEWPSQIQSLCRSLSWPFSGQPLFYNCKVVFSIF